MPRDLKNYLPLLLALCVVAAAVVILLREPAPPPGPPPPAEPVKPPVGSALSVLGEAPDWSRLNDWQNTITREDFARLLTTVFTTGSKWMDFIEIRDESAVIRTGDDPASPAFHLRFAPPGLAEPARRSWKTPGELPPPPPGKPLDGLHIAIDPGHIGGEWSKLEGRWMQLGNTPPVKEGDMTLLVARLIKPRLEELGARVSLVREKNEPITPLRPDSLLDAARETAAPDDSPAGLQKLAERLFYRTAEIRARARLVNETLKPDLVLCLHFNAEPWGDPANPTLVPRTHLHLLLNGAYNDEEVAFPDQRFALLAKLLSRTHEEESLVGATVADVFAEKSGLPPYIYPAASRNALPVNGHPYLWARNLLANRLYDCPVIFMEPYVMNSTIDHPRLAAGDYEGLREINGRLQASIFREYAGALVDGLRRHYEQARKPAP